MISCLEIQHRLDSIPMRYAVLCADDGCDTLFDTRQSRQCPQCGSVLFATVSRWLNRV